MLTSTLSHSSRRPQRCLRASRCKYSLRHLSPLSHPVQYNSTGRRISQSKQLTKPQRRRPRHSQAPSSPGITQPCRASCPVTRRTRTTRCRSSLRLTRPCPACPRRPASRARTWTMRRTMHTVRPACPSPRCTPGSVPYRRRPQQQQQQVHSKAVRREIPRTQRATRTRTTPSRTARFLGSAWDTRGVSASR